MLNGISTAGKWAAGVAKAAAVVSGVAAAAIGAIGKSSIKAYAEYEQVVGGVETLFKNSSRLVQKYAETAYRTAGMSATEYMSTVTGFSASLLQSLGGDTEAAAKVADMAVTDMADNANKMGTSIDAIQNAYQGFAKGQYQLLDNLKIGYGGTRSEMLRLLADAEKISGVHYDIENLNDVYSAIHVIQTELDITGTTAKEAASTIQGSFAMAKAAWQNMLVGISDENADFESLINNLVSSVGTAAGNILPRVEIALNGIANLVVALAPMIADNLPSLMDSLLPPLISGAVYLTRSLVQALPGIIDLLLSQLPVFISGLEAAAGEVIAALPSIVESIASSLPILLPQIITAAVNLIVLICQNLPKIIQPIIDNLPQIVTSVMSALVSNLPIIIAAILSLIVSIARQLPQLLVAVGSALLGALGSIWDEIVGFFEPILSGIGDWIYTNVISPIVEFFVGLGADIKSVWDDIWGGIKGVINSIIGGINGMISAVCNGINTVVRAVNTLHWEIPDYVPIVGGKTFGFDLKEITAPQIPLLARGGVLEKNQTGFLEGTGAEAVVPLENNRKWIRAVANDMNGEIGGGSSKSLEDKIDILIEAVKEIAQMELRLSTGELVGVLSDKLDNTLGQKVVIKKRTTLT